jgi:branched-chain amino acid transport system permease protein
MIEFGIPTVPFFGIDIVSFTIDFGIAYALILAVSLTLNLEAGYAGVPNFGKVLFVAGGAAVAGAVTGRLAVLLLNINTSGDYNTHIAQVINRANLSLGDNFPLSIEILLAGVVLGAIVGAGLGVIFSVVASRENLREDYLGMLLLAAAQFFQIFLRSYEPLIGGTQGILVPDVFAWASPCPQGQTCSSFHGIVLVPSLVALTGLKVRDVAVLLTVVTFCGLVYLYSEGIARSPLGRMLRAIRDDDIASKALGKNDVAVRRNVIVIASAISGVAGALITFYSSTVGADTWTRVTWTFYPWLVVIIGGAANNLGVGLGAFVFVLLLKGIDQVKFRFQSFIPFDVNWLEYLAFASLLILFLFFRPGGIVPEQPSKTLSELEIANTMNDRGTRRGENSKELMSSSRTIESSADPIKEYKEQPSQG